MWGIFTAVAGFLLFIDLTLRLLYEMHKAGWDKWRLPAFQWRLSMVAVLLVIVVSSLHSVLTVLQNDQDGSRYFHLDYIQTTWGVVVFLIKIVAIIIVDITKPVIQDQLEAVPLTRKFPEPSQLGSHLMTIITCFWFSAIVWYYAKTHIGV